MFAKLLKQITFVKYKSNIEISARKMKKFTLALLAFSAVMTLQARTTQLLEKDWLFTRSGDTTAMASPGYDDSGWQKVRIPHDWAVYEPFSIHNDMQDVAITQDGQKEAMEHAGRTGGLPFVGTGWYRRNLDLTGITPESKVTLTFDGAMADARVYVNGKEAIHWSYGYNSFYVDITPYVTPDAENLIAVRLENLPESSRWYPGAGLYRNVHLTVTDPAHIDTWGTAIRTPDITPEWANVDVATRITLPENATPGNYKLKTVVINPDGDVAGCGEISLANLYSSPRGVERRITIKDPSLWSPESPERYTLIEELLDGTGAVTDRVETRFGVRKFEIIPDSGAYLNGKPMVFKGVCMHHDLGMLGAATNAAAVRRQIRILKDMGANAIRTSHNMPSPEVVEACDSMGMLLMAESFDEWKKPKVKNGYNRLFDRWAERDLVNLIRHYYNSPAIVMWCIGNEVSEQWHPGDCKTALWLQQICHREDPTRMVTQGMDGPDAVVNNNFAAVMDVAGFNYRPFKYRENYAKLPQRVILGSETASTLSSRGVYKFPVERKSMAKYADHQASSYDVEHCGWSDLPEDNFIYHDDLPYCIGEFVWTGFDYLGEPTPYYSDWPSHSSLFGIVDLAGLPKDRYWLYRSHWNETDTTLHILPHWTFPGREGEVTPVFVYSSFPKAELFVNGISQGMREKDLTVAIDSSYTEEAQRTFERQKRYRLMWNDVVYQPGEVKVVAYDAEGNPAAEQIVKTAGKPYALKLKADRNTLSADGRDMAFVEVSVVDRNGVECPDACNDVKFRATGAASYEASANGNPASLESFQADHMKLFSGKLTTAVRASEKPGKAALTVSAKGLKPATVQLEIK